jgi:methyltransferase (TIGR00027 family)
VDCSCRFPRANLSGVTDSTIHNVSDTALWVAIFRARETEREDAIFSDPYARVLAGERGEEIAKAMPFLEKASWAMVTRTVLFDDYVREAVASGVDMVVNLAAGLDTRPYRMDLPENLQWVEVDLPAITDYKEDILRHERPKCRLERVRLDLADVAARRELFARLGARAKRALVLAEGLLVYLTPDQVCGLAKDLAAQPSFETWVIDIASPGLLQMMKKQMGAKMTAPDATMKFAPLEGPAFFEKCGWKPVDIRSTFKNAGRLRRLPGFLKLFSFLPDPKQPAGRKIWSGSVAMKNQYSTKPSSG